MVSFVYVFDMHIDHASEPNTKRRVHYMYHSCVWVCIISFEYVFGLH